jgi:hypothetical protein
LSSADNKETSELSVQFNTWVDRVMSEFGATPSVAYNFNLYEHEEEFAIQLVGTSRFDPDDEDWACDETFSSGEDLFCLPHAVFGTEWRTALKVASSLVENYLQHGKYATLMKASRAVGAGFVSGEIELVHLR